VPATSNRLDTFIGSTFISIASGIGITLSLAPFNYWPLAILSAGCLFLLMQGKNIRQAAIFGWLFGLGLFGSGASWVYVSIHDFAYTSTAMAAFLTALFCACLALFCALTWGFYLWVLNGFKFTTINKNKTSYGSWLPVLLFASIWVLGEWLRSWLLTGFPWLFVGYSQTESILSPWASIVGVYGISFIIVASGAQIAVLGNRFIRKNISGSAQANDTQKIAAVSISLLIVWLLPVAVAFPSWTEKNDRAITVSMVQANISQHDKWQRKYRQQHLALYLRLTDPHWQSSDVIIWPEAAIPIFHDRAFALLDTLNDRANSNQSAFITGIPTRDLNSSSRYNSLIALGTGKGSYQKQKLVPFGEYIPFVNVLGNLLAFFDLPVAVMSAGDPKQSPLEIDGWRAQPLICYEVVYPNFTAKAAANSQVLITVSNDSWFGRSIGPLQHLQMAQMRAIENQQYVLRSTGNGVTAIIDPNGNITQRSEQFEQAVVSGEFFTISGQTPWTRYGYWLIPSLCGMLCISSGILIRRQQYERLEAS
tara:strand:- start:3680 stop:5284 length:1605 start_codon:yes stop_codon:yes gene_type:complete